MAHSDSLESDDLLRDRSTLCGHQGGCASARPLEERRVGGKTIGKRRAKHLVEIASAYTPDELLCEPGVGQVTVTEIQLWLKERDASLRSAH